MPDNQAKTLCVVGAGNMGHQIALQGALCGFQVYCNDINESTLRGAEEFARNWLAGRVQKGKMTAEEARAVSDRLIFTQDLDEAARHSDLVIEAIVEILEVKRKLFKRLDEICPAHTILATNSSYIVSSKLADAVARPDKVINMHFFNPALVMKLVEVVKGPHVSEETVEIVFEVCRALQKTPVRVNKEIYGFVVNRVFSAITKEACYLLDQGIASIEDIDIAVRNGLGHPLGPFELLDLTGIDLEYNVLMEKYQSTGNLNDKPSPALVERWAKGEYGRKTRRGFYDYNSK
ncbi:MAG: 3-hydroxyacyl-CoA dehydrogenase family protein [Firmicutes bacterium]|nr:3-hydroxyacyl-CoA dehydrogenase family protein [Bacillota bacterium]